MAHPVIIHGSRSISITLLLHALLGAGCNPYGPSQSESSAAAGNTAAEPIVARLLIAQGLADNVVLSTATDAYVDQRCAVCKELEYLTIAGLDHAGIVHSETFDEALAQWTAARFANEPRAIVCIRTSLQGALRQFRTLGR